MSTNHHVTIASLGFTRCRLPTHQSISALARAIWENLKCPHGHDLEIWLHAENLLASGRRTAPISIRDRFDEDYPATVPVRRSATSL